MMPGSLKDVRNKLDRTSRNKTPPETFDCVINRRGPRSVSYFRFGNMYCINV